ncbi:MAG: alpha/beta fold hydrolase [bacterium]|nr:alpha/beta fold hydrolase [bacterium]
MPRAQTNGIELEYEVHGPPDGRPLLLIQGLGMQLIHWDPGLCEQLVARGHRVVRFDNRDVGRSTWLDDLGFPNIAAAMGAAARGETAEAPYILADMARDVAGLLDALGWASAHVVGVSMGGMIAQTLAIEHPERVRSLTSIMSSSGAPGLPGPTAEAAMVLMSPPPPDREGAIASAVTAFRTIGSPGYPIEEDFLRARAAAAYDRGFHPLGIGRQLAAILSSGSRRAGLAGVRVPTLVIHGRQDPLVPLACGEDTAGAVPGARLEVIDGMGHDLPPALWPRLVELISEHTRRADA